jgi:hypothetical protein
MNYANGKDNTTRRCFFAECIDNSILSFSLSDLEVEGSPKWTLSGFRAFDFGEVREKFIGHFRV